MCAQQTEARRAYVRKSYAAHREARLARSRKYQMDHPELYQKAARKWYWGNREDVCETARVKRAQSPEKSKEVSRRSYWKHRDQRLVTMRIWRELHRDDWLVQCRITRARMRAENGDAVRAQARQRYADNPESAIACVSRRRARKLKAPGYCYTTAVHMLGRVELFGGRCVYCGSPYEALDHGVPLAKGGTHFPANLRPSCRSCNSSKGSKSLSAWFALNPERRSKMFDFIHAGP